MTDPLLLQSQIDLLASGEACRCCGHVPQLAGGAGFVAALVEAGWPTADIARLYHVEEAVLLETIGPLPVPGPAPPEPPGRPGGDPPPKEGKPLGHYLDKTYRARAAGMGSAPAASAELAAAIGLDPALRAEAAAMLASLTEEICQRCFISKTRRDVLREALAL